MVYSLFECYPRIPSGIIILFLKNLNRTFGHLNRSSQARNRAPWVQNLVIYASKALSTPIRFHLKTQRFLYGYSFCPHVSDEKDQSKRIFLTTLRTQYQFKSTPRNIRNLLKMADGRFPFFSFILGLISNLIAYFQENLALLILQADHSRRRQNIIRLFPLPVSRGKRLVLPLVWLCFCPDIDILNCFCDFEKMKGRSNLDQRNSKMAPYIFIIANTYASSMCSRVSYPFQIYSSYTCGQAKTVRKRYKWKRIFLKTEKKSCVFKRIRIRVDKA